MNSSGFEYCPLLAEVIFAQRAVGKSGREYTGLSSLSTNNNLHVIRNMVLDFKPKDTLEIGLAFGGSALVFASTHRDLGVGQSKQHVAIDPFQSTVWDGVAKKLLEESMLGGFVDVLEDYSSACLPLLLQQGRKFDLIYVDGSHLFEDVFVDCFYALQLLRPQGRLLLDDCTDRHVRKVINFLRTNMIGHVNELCVDCYRQSNLGIKHRIAKAVGRSQLTCFEKIGTCSREWNAPFIRF